MPKSIVEFSSNYQNVLTLTFIVKMEDCIIFNRSVLKNFLQIKTENSTTRKYSSVMSCRDKVTSHVSKSDRSSNICYTFETRENLQSLFEKSKIHDDTNCVIIPSQKPKHNLTKIKRKLSQKRQS